MTMILCEFRGVPLLPALSVPTTDAVVICVYLLGTVLLGFWVGRGQKNLNDYLLGDRNLPWWAVLGSIVATETSTATVLSIPGLAYVQNGDMRFLQLAIGYLLGRLFVSWALLPQYFQGQLFTSYEVLNHRFGGATKTTASLLFLFARTFGDGLRLYLAALVLAQFAQVDLAVAIWIVGLVTIVYTVFGGIRSVVWNDCVQLIIYLIGGFVIVGLIVQRLPGGLGAIWEFGKSTGRFEILDFTFHPLSNPDLFWSNFTDPHLFWAGLIGGFFLTLGTHGTDQLTVQRLLSARGLVDARKALITSGVVVFGQFLLFLFVGVCLAAYFTEFPSSTPIEKGDEVVTTFIVHELPIGLRGILLAAIFAAAMSTLSSSLNSSASSAINDLMLPFLPNRTPGALLTIGRILTIAFGFAQIGVGLMADNVMRWVGQSQGNDVVSSVLAIASFTTGIILGLFFLGVFTKRVGQAAALIGMVAGAIVTIGLFTLGAREEFDRIGLPADFKLAWTWYACVGSVVVFVVGYLASFLLPRRRDAIA